MPESWSAFASPEELEQIEVIAKRIQDHTSNLLFDINLLRSFEMRLEKRILEEGRSRNQIEHEGGKGEVVAA